MNDTPKYALTLESILHRHNGDLATLDMETLEALADEADKAVFDAGIALDFIRTVIAKKREIENANPQAGA